MKLLSTAIFSALLASTCLAQPHHIHRKRQVTTVDTYAATVTDNLDVTVYMDDNGNLVTEFPSTTVAPTTLSLVQNTNVAKADAENDAQVSSGTAVNSATYATAATSDSSSASTGSSTGSSSSSSSSGIDGDLANFENPSKKFVDGTLPCSSVPVGQGVISLDWLPYNGWASLLSVGGVSSNNCEEGHYCSYACQAGMSKTQWPALQPSSGESRGGLVCQNGKLYRTNTATDYLCEWGAQTANAVSKIDKVVSLCRTDYPGSENMCIPTRLTSGASKPISVVQSETYYKWLGQSTSAQYYVNNAGIDVEQGCIWGTSAGTVGNWAPVVLGAGKTAGVTYLSIIPNPNNKTPPNYNLKIEASEGATMSGKCVYSNGVYNGQGTDGCTVGVTKGAANFVFY